MTSLDVTVVIPSIPIRSGMLGRALDSVANQSVQPRDVEVSIDYGRVGSAINRNRALNRVQTEWSAFLDDDDHLIQDHLSTYMDAIHGRESDYDVIYTGCMVLDPNGNEVPRQDEWGRFGREFDPDILRQRSYLPVTSMVRTSLAHQVGGFSTPPGSIYDDWGFYLKMLDAGARFLHVSAVTWIWNHHGLNTSGQANRW